MQLTRNMLKGTKRCQILAIPIAKNDIFFYVRTWIKPVPISSNDTSSLAQKWRARIDGWVDWAATKWEKLGSEPENSFKGKLYSAGNFILDRVDADEWFLKEIATDSQEAMVIYPSEFNPKEIENRMDLLVRDRIRYHSRYRSLSFVAIPFSIMAGILPGPNVFLAYNLFRLYSHDKALAGAKRLESLTKGQKLEYIADETLNEILRERKSPLQTEIMKQINELYSMPGYFLHDVKRTRKQWQLKNGKK